MATYHRSVGPKADVRELQYVAALQQTCDWESRTSGTVSSLDILRFLRSRYCVQASQEEARDIVRGLGGGFPSDPARRGIANSIRDEMEVAEPIQQQHVGRWKKQPVDDQPSREEFVQEISQPRIEYLDLVALQAVLLIPTFARYAKKFMEARNGSFAETGATPDHSEHASGHEADGNGENGCSTLDPKPEDLIEFVFLLMRRAVGENSVDGKSDDDPSVLSPAIVRKLLIYNGEYEKANDKKLVQEMADVATKQSNRFDELALVQAIAGDLGGWEVGCEDHVSSFEEDIILRQRSRNISSEAENLTGGIKPSSDDTMRSDMNRGSEENEGNQAVEPDMGTTQPPETEIRPVRFSLQFLDSMVDTQGSSFAWILSWLTYMVTSLLFTAVTLSKEPFNVVCGESDQACVFGQTLAEWMSTAVMFSVLGVTGK